MINDYDVAQRLGILNNIKSMPESNAAEQQAKVEQLKEFIEDEKRLFSNQTTQGEPVGKSEVYRSANSALSRLINPIPRRINQITFFPDNHNQEINHVTSEVNNLNFNRVS